MCFDSWIFPWHPDSPDRNVMQWARIACAIGLASMGVVHSTGRGTVGWKIKQFITVKQRKIEVGRNLWRSAVQPATQSRVNSKTRSACSGPCLGKFGESPRMAIALALWSLCLHCTTIMGNNVFLCLMGISLVVISVYYLLSFHCVALKCLAS